MKNNKLFKYLREAKQELQKVSWPTQKQTMRYSAIIIAISILLAIYFGIFDFILNIGLEKLIELTSNK